jgi:hypothetical protein
MRTLRQRIGATGEHLSNARRNSMSTLELTCVGFLLLVYGGSGLAELPMWRRFAPDYVRWGYARSWAIATPLIKLAAAALVAIPQTRMVGAVLCSLVALAAVGSVVRAKEPPRILIASVVCILTLGATVLLLRMHSNAAGPPYIN